MSELCNCELKVDCPVHGEFAKREANATSMTEFLPEIAVAKLDSGRYVIVDEANVKQVMEQLARDTKGGSVSQIACYRLAKIEGVKRTIQ